MQKIIWKKIKDYDNYYISSDGKIYNSKKDNFLKYSISKEGYARGVLSNKKHKHFQVHRLVAETFIPNPTNKPQVNHKDGNKLNNTIDNLEWVTASENLIHSYRVLNRRHPLQGKHHSLKSKEKMSNIKKGKKLSNETKIKKSKPVVQLLGDTTINIYYGITEASRQTGINLSSISSCCKNKRKTAGGYNWKFYKKEGE